MAVLHPHTCRPCLQRLFSPVLIRPLSITPSRQKHGALPVFTPTSSPELDNLLSTFRTNIFLPAHLSKPQRDIIYRPKNHVLLTADDPATVAIGDEVLQMHPLNRMRDEPSWRPALAQLLELMREGKDWINLPEFLRGLRESKRKLKGWQMEKVTRKACMAGREGVIMMCLQRVKQTDLGLWEPAVVRELMWAAVRKAQAGDWKKEAVEAGVKFAEDVWVMMQDPNQIDVAKKRGKIDSMRRPEVVGVLVLLHAARAAMFGGGKDEGGKVAKYVERLLTVWEGFDMTFKEGDWNQANQNLMMLAPVWSGMQMARRVLRKGSDRGKELGVILAECESALPNLRNTIMAHQPKECVRRGLNMYDELSKICS